ncbi:MAG: DUF6189 family protein [Micromonosporaceae bacterium]
MYDRIPAQYHEGMEAALDGGELRIAVEDLMAGLAQLRIPVTPAERDRLAHMLAYLKEPESKLDTLNVVATSG